MIRAPQPYFKVLNKNLDLSKYVSSVHYRGNLSNAADSFTVKLSFKSNFETITNYNLAASVRGMLDTNDIVNIGCEKPGLCIGLIDRITKSKEVTTDNYNRELIVTGRNFAKLLIDDKVEFAPQLQGDAKAVQILGKERVEFLGALFRGIDGQGKGSQFWFSNPICAILYVLKNMPAVRIEVPFYDGDSDFHTMTEPELNRLRDAVQNTQAMARVGEYLVCDMKAFIGDQVADVNLSQYTGQIYNYMMQCIDKDFYEMFVDTIEIKTPAGTEWRPCLFLRPKPFDRTTDPAQQLLDAVKTNQQEGTIANISFTEKGAFKTKEQKVGRTIVKNAVIYPSIKRNDIVFNGGSVKDNVVVNRVELADVDDTGLPKDSPRFKGERDVNNPDDPENKSMFVNWTWDSPKSFFRTMITNEPYHIIPEDRIRADDLGSDDSDVINYISFYPRKDIFTTTPLGVFGQLFPMLDGYSIRRFGVRSYRSESNLIKTQTLDPSQIQAYQIKDPDNYDVFQVSDLIQARERLFCWHRYNPFLENGRIIIWGDQDIRKGDPVFLPHEISRMGRKGVKAYVQGVEHMIQVTSGGMNYHSILTLERGENPEDIEFYRSQTNRKEGNTIKLGTTYKAFDEALGMPSSEEEQFDGDGKSLNPKSHNIIKFDLFLQKKIKGAGTVDNKTTDEIINEDTTPEKNVPGNRKTKRSVTASVSKENVLKMIDKGILTAGTSQLNDLKTGSGRSSDKSEVHNIFPVIYELLEMLGQKEFGFPIRIGSVITGHSYWTADGGQSAHGKGHAIDISVAGAPSSFGVVGSKDYINKITKLATCIIKEIDYSLSTATRQIICTPYQDTKKDAPYCSITIREGGKTQKNHNNHIHIGW